MPSISRNERIHGGLLGLLIGDALGVPYEFHPPSEIPPPEQLDFTPPPGFARAHRSVPPGTWSDDGAHALALLASLLDREQVDLGDFAQRLVEWYDHGAYAVDGDVFDVGIQTSRAIHNIRYGTPPDRSGPADEQKNGNGSLMRVLPLALWHRGTDAELIANARRQSLVTHGHLRSQLCCALYCLWARRVLEERPNPWDDAVKTLRSMLPADGPETTELEWRIRPDDDTPGRGSGYVVDTLRSARDVVRANTSYESTVKAAIVLGHDTDTTACVAGGIAGLLYGVNGIPLRWRQALRGQELVTPLMTLLLSRP